MYLLKKLTYKPQKISIFNRRFIRNIYLLRTDKYLHSLKRMGAFTYIPRQSH